MIQSSFEEAYFSTSLVIVVVVFNLFITYPTNSNVFETI